MKKIMGRNKKMVLAALLAGVMSLGWLGGAAEAAEKGGTAMKSAETKADRQIKASAKAITAVRHLFLFMIRSPHPDDFKFPSKKLRSLFRLIPSSISNSSVSFCMIIISDCFFIC